MAMMEITEALGVGVCVVLAVRRVPATIGRGRIQPKPCA